MGRGSTTDPGVVGGMDRRRLRRRGVQRAMVGMAAAASVIAAPLPRPALAAGTSAPLAAPGSGVAPQVVPPPAPQPNVLLITIDTLRADRIGSVGYFGALTPALNRLAAEGAAGAAYVQTPQTNANHATILTGTYVQTHGLRSLIVDKAYPWIPLLSELFRSAGYRTAAHFSWFTLADELSGLGRGWDTTEDYTVRSADGRRLAPGEALEMFVPGFGTTEELDGRADVTTEGMLRWLDEAGTLSDRPWFVWLHYRDPHWPFIPPPPYDALPDTGADFDGSGRNVGRVSGGYRPAWRELARLIAAYNGEIAFTDSQLRRLLEHLDRRGLASRTIVVVTGDHGESFLEHGAWLHGHSVYETEVRVPFFLRHSGNPSRVLPGRVLPGLIQSADIAPTVLELCGLSIAPTMEGRSLVPLLAGREESGPPRAAWGNLNDDTRLYVASGGWKLVRRNDGSGPVVDELYHLPTDPEEGHNLIGEAKEPAARLIGQLEAWLSAKAAGRRWRPWETG